MTDHRRSRFLSFVVVLSLSLIGSSSSLPTECCRSNVTHVVWRKTPSEFVDKRGLSRGHPDDCQCDVALRQDEEKEAMTFLRKNVMAFDLGKLETLGFGSDDDVDGLSYGIVQPTISLSLDTKKKHTWTDALPKSVFMEYVLNYANTNEARTNWRPLLTEVVESILAEYPPKDDSVKEVVKIINTYLWKRLAPKDKSSIVFVSGQTPLVYDPMSVMVFGYGSCTGLAILFANALRAAGVAARVVGTPAWMGERKNGNHNWVEVFDGSAWQFLEPAPSGSVDTLDRKPCERWFCHPDRFNDSNRTSPVYAARLDQANSDTYYPLAWEWTSTDVPGEDRSPYYIPTCSRC